MNKKVLRTMITLVVVFLIALYVLKIFFPEQFVMAIENEKLVEIGQYIDAHKWLLIACAVITSFITYWLYLCATLNKWKLNWKEIVAILIAILIVQITYEFDATLSSGLSIISMFIIPMIFNAQLKNVAITFSIHYMSQLLSTLIRNLPLLLTNINTITIILFGAECYLWLLLLYFYFNYKKEKV